MATSPLQVVYSNLNFPVAFTFTHDGRIFFDEKNAGNIRVILSDGTILATAFATLGPLATIHPEQGLLGIVLDPNFDTNGYLYVYWTYWNGTYTHGRITRFTATGNVGTSPKLIFDVTDPTPDTGYHDGGYLKFGPDGKLYVVIGEFGDPSLSQDPTYYAGKILRMNSDGSVPSDNPFPGSLIYASGIRNGFGMDFSSTGRLIATVAGPDCCDKIDVILPGANYGWPICGIDSEPLCPSPYTNAIYQWGMPTVTPTGIIYSSDPDVVYFGEYNTGNFMRLVLTSSGTVAEVDTIATVGSPFNGILGVEGGHDGLIYFSTPTAIYRFTPTVTSTLTQRASQQPAPLGP